MSNINPTFYDDARKAINQAASQAPACVGYAKEHGWFVYDPLFGCPDGEPEFFIAKQGTQPIPLSDIAAQVWVSCLQEST